MFIQSRRGLQKTECVRYQARDT